MGAALVLRLLWMWLASPVPVSDFETFRQLGADLLAHGQFGWPEPTAYRFPAYPWLLAVAMRVSASVAWLRFVDVLLSAALVPAAYALAKRLAAGDARYGLAAAWVCALNPGFVFWAPILASEHPFALLVFLGLALIARQGGAGAPARALSGVCLGLASLTRGEGLFQVPTFLLTAWLVTPPRVHDSRGALATRRLSCSRSCSSWADGSRATSRKWGPAPASPLPAA